jgi:hypothetical protein
MKAADERGIALVMVLILLGVLSTLAASLIFVSQTETWSSQNYRLMTEARYAAETGVHRAANYLMYTYPAPSTSADLAAFTFEDTSPVRYGTQPVQLRSNGASNYPVTSVATDFTNAVHGTLTGGSDPVTYDARVSLISMRQVMVYGATTPVTVQTWQIVGEGTIGGAKPARVDVSAIVERQVMNVFNYAAFATDPGCGALSWSGGGSTDSYDSSIGPSSISSNGGNVGTNGNLDENGGPTIIHGSLSTPRSGVGSCSTGAVTALTLSGSSPPDAGLIELPQAINYPVPSVPPLSATPVSVAHGVVTPLAPGTYGNIDINGTLQLSAGVYNINSLTINAHASFGIQITSGPVVLNIAGFSTAGDASSGYMSTPLDLTGQAGVNISTLDPSLLQMTYAGTAELKLTGGADCAGLLYAPNATVKNNSAGVEWFGAVIAKKVTDSGHAVIHYDRRLQNSSKMVGPWMLDSFSWRKF